MTKFFTFATRAAVVLALTFVTIVLWSVTTHAADTATTVKHNANGSTTTCTYQSEFVTARDGAHMFRKAWICVTSK